MAKMIKYVRYEPAVGSTFAATVKGEKVKLIASEYGKNIKNPCNKCAFTCKTCNPEFGDTFLCGNNGKCRSDGVQVQFLVTEE